MLDFTAPTCGPEHPAAIAAGVPSVVGTTGWDTEEVDSSTHAPGLPVFYAANFSIGGVLMMRFAGEASRLLDGAEIVELHHADEAGCALRARPRRRRPRCEGDVPIHSVRLPGPRLPPGGDFRGRGRPSRSATTLPPRGVSRRAPGTLEARRVSAGPHLRPRRPPLVRSSSRRVEHRRRRALPCFARATPRRCSTRRPSLVDEFLPYWAELWPSGLALARALPLRGSRGWRVIELGAGLGVPSLVAAARGARGDRDRLGGGLGRAARSGTPPATGCPAIAPIIADWGLVLRRRLRRAGPRRRPALRGAERRAAARTAAVARRPGAARRPRPALRGRLPPARPRAVGDTTRSPTASIRYGSCKKKIRCISNVEPQCATGVRNEAARTIDRCSAAS